MTASARFLFIIAILTFVGCSSSEPAATDAASKPEVNVEQSKEKPASTDTADEMKLAPAPALDLKEDLVENLAPSDPNFLKLSPSEPAPLSDPASTLEKPESNADALPLTPPVEMSQPEIGASDLGTPVTGGPAVPDGLALDTPVPNNALALDETPKEEVSGEEAPAKKTISDYPAYAGLTPSSPTLSETPQPALTRPELSQPALTQPEVNQPMPAQLEVTPPETVPPVAAGPEENSTLNQTPMVPFTDPKSEAMPEPTPGIASEAAANAPSLSSALFNDGGAIAGELSGKNVPAEAPSLATPETQPLTPMTPADSEQAPLSSALSSPATSSPLSPSMPPTSQGNPLRNGRTSEGIRPGMDASPSLPGDTPPANERRPEEANATEGAAGPAFNEPPATAEKAAMSAESESPAAGSEKSTEVRPNSKGQPFDPIEENGRYFVDWPKPALALVMTGRQNGYIEPCGCAGMERMKGGLKRRDTMIKDLEEKQKWPVVALDLGNQVKGHKRQTELKFQHTTESLLEMGYDGVGLGIADLQLPAGELAAITSNENSPFVSANVDLFEPGTELIAKYRIAEKNGIKVGITAVLGNSFRKQINNKSIPTIDPVTAIEQVADKIKDCEVRVLLAYADGKESEALAKRFPMFNVVVTAAGGPLPPKDSVVIPGTKTYLVQVGEKGESAIVLGLYRDKENPVRYQRVILDSRFPASEKIHRLMSAYQEQLKMLGYEGLNIKPVPCAEAATKGKYVGSKACATCHEQSYDIWRKSKHAHAWQTLVEADPPRNYDPECISCHVIGWDPQRYYPLEGGFVSSEKTPQLENVGCESCHGPGGAHVKAEEGGDMELQERLQKAMIVTIAESRSDPQKMCYNCHDLDNSPEFDFDKYWPEVKHYETESGEKEDDE